MLKSGHGPEDRRGAEGRQLEEDAIRLLGEQPVADSADSGHGKRAVSGRRQDMYSPQAGCRPRRGWQEEEEASGPGGEYRGSERDIISVGAAAVGSSSSRRVGFGVSGHGTAVLEAAFETRGEGLGGGMGQEKMPATPDSGYSTGLSTPGYGTSYFISVTS